MAARPALLLLRGRSMTWTVTAGFSACMPSNGLLASAKLHTSTKHSRDASTKPSEKALPKLPVPTLEETMRTYMRVASAIANRDELLQVDALIQDYLKSEHGRQCQEWLLNRERNTENWLADLWLRVAYLEPRYTMAINTSPALSFPKFTGYNGVDGQLQLAARLTHIFAQYKLAIESDALPGDGMDMSQFKLLFGTTQRPNYKCDTMMYGIDRQTKHIVVMRHGHFFEVPIFDDGWKPLSTNALYAALKQCHEAASQSAAKEALGICTTLDRDSWADIHHAVEGASENNRAIIESLETAQFVLCLDEPYPEPHMKDRDIDVQLQMLLHGGGARLNSNNRWFDKCIQLIVSTDGFAGICYCHSPAEGPAVAALMDYACDMMDKKQSTEQSSRPASVKEMQFDLNDSQRQTIRSAQHAWNSRCAEIELTVLDFKDYGKNLIKQAKMSPDSYIQMAFQMAYFKLHQNHAPAYETGTLRRFTLGRTDTIRSPSHLSRTLVGSQMDRSMTLEQTYQLLREAVQAHNAYAKMTQSGKGIDRHMLGLRLAANALDLDPHPLFEHHVYKRSLYFQLSTSQVPTKHDINLAFGPATPDCYGVCYNPKADSVNFMITTFGTHPNTRAKDFAAALGQTLRFMRTVLTGAGVIESAKL